MFEEQKAFLKEWLILYLKNKDAFYRKISTIDENDGKIIVNYKDSKKEYGFFEPILNDMKFLDGLQHSELIIIVTFNMKENLSDLMDSWKKLVKYPQLKIIFINPNSTTENKWIINPYLHDKFCDDDSFAQGIETLFSNVESLTRDDI